MRVVLPLLALTLASGCEAPTFPALPVPRAAHGAAVIDGLILVAGGASEEGNTARLDILDPAKGEWRKGRDLPTPRAFPGVVALEGALFVLGGMRGREGHLATVERYDPKRDLWEPRTPLGLARSRFACATVSGSIVVAGGYLGDGDTDTVEVYDPGKDAWRPGPPLPLKIHGLAAAVLLGKLHLFGGFGDGAIHLRLDGDCWTRLRPMGTARIFLAADVVGGKILAAGGRVQDAPLEAYDPAKDAWAPLRGMQRSVNRFAAVAFEGRFVALGGEGIDGRFVDAVVVYDPATDRWR